MLGFLSKMISQNVPKCQASFDKLSYIPEAGEHSFPWGRESRDGDGVGRTGLTGGILLCISWGTPVVQSLATSESICSDNSGPECVAGPYLGQG